MSRLRPTTVAEYGHAERIPSADFDWLVRSREWAWNQPLAQLEGVMRAGVAALLFGGELAVRQPIEVLRRITLADVVLDGRNVWLFIQPPDCSDAYPIALRADTALWVVYALAEWVARHGAQSTAKPFASISVGDVEDMASSLIARDCPTRLPDLIAANRAFLRTRYPADTVGYLAGVWDRLKIACPGPTRAPHERRYDAWRSDVPEMTLPLRSALRDLAHSEPASKPPIFRLERYLGQRAEQRLVQLGGVSRGSIRARLVEATAALLHGGGADALALNTLLGLLLGLELIHLHPDYSARSVETYLSRIESWVGLAGSARCGQRVMCSIVRRPRGGACWRAPRCGSSRHCACHSRSRRERRLRSADGSTTWTSRSCRSRFGWITSTPCRCPWMADDPCRRSSYLRVYCARPPSNAWSSPS